MLPKVLQEKTETKSVQNQTNSNHQPIPDEHYQVTVDFAYDFGYNATAEYKANTIFCYLGAVENGTKHLFSHRGTGKIEVSPEDHGFSFNEMFKFVTPEKKDWYPTPGTIFKVNQRTEYCLDIVGGGCRFPSWGKGAVVEFLSYQYWGSKIVSFTFSCQGKKGKFMLDKDNPQKNFEQHFKQMATKNESKEMNIIEKIQKDVYENTEAFKADALAHTKIADHPKADRAFEMAWDQAHSNGYLQVLYALDDLADLMV